uniref:Glycosyltransferase n=1 Tax=Oryza glumipatula TaxID=40148 RepID=A0A0E0AHP4_9ORYZ
MATAHVLVFPAPAQGHLNCFLHFATALLRAGLHVTFLHTHHNLRRLGAAAAAAAAISPRLRFLSVPDGLPDDDPRRVDGLPELMEGLRTTGSAAYRALLASLVVRAAAYGRASSPTAYCRSPSTSPRSSACRRSHSGRLIELGELPFPGRGGDDGLDERVRGVPGMESFLRRRDLPIQCRHLAATTTHGDPLLTSVVAATAHSRNARALLNTAISLEHPALTHLARHMRDVFAIGPLHAMSPAPAAATSLWRHDDGCMAWLDSQPNQSVVYVSLGSLTVISHEQFTELLSGLLAAVYPFLWVLRPDCEVSGRKLTMILWQLNKPLNTNMAGNNHNDALLRQALLDVAGAGASVVPWAPQRDVLRHRAVGCFLTHSGWNSTAEGVAEGVPMVCWPFFADQQINSRLVGAVWGNGVDMKDACERGVVERSVKEAMESGEIRRSACRLAEQVKRDTGDGDLSVLEFERLVGFIRELSKVDDEPLVEKCSLLPV